MKNIFKSVAVLALLAMACMLMTVTAMGANPDGVVFTATIDTPVITVSDEAQTVTVTITTSDKAAFDCDGIGATVLSAENFGTAVSNPEITFTAGDYNAANGVFGWSHDFASTEYVTISNVMVITYTIPANTPAGTYTLGVEALQITKDWGSDWEDNGVASATLTIKAAHTHDYNAVVTAPTCTEGGYTTYTCDCGDSYTADETSATGHSYDAVVTAPTCTEGGYTTYTCDCGDSYVDDETPATGHSYKAEVTEPTCTEDGYTTYTCDCGDSYTADETPAGHKYDAEVTEPTCTEDGYTTYTCSKCGDSYVDDETPATGHSYKDDHTCDCGAVEPAGWVEIDGNWYYVDPTTYEKATGLTRVPYPTVEVNGIIFEANSEDVDYAAGNENTKYTDKDSAVFCFDENGVFQVELNGLVDGNRCAVNGVVVWHAGLVEIDGAYYYFIGDENGNGNVMVTNKLQYVTRDATDLGVENGYYYFGADGKLVENNGIVDINGVLYYFEDSRLASDAGLVEIDGAYYYVRSRNGQIVVDNEYWVADTNGLAEAGIYLFDENGKMVMGEVDGNGEGIVEIDGAYYYYENGKCMKGAGVIEMTDDNGETFYIYVTRNGQLATGEYWPTNRNDLLESGAYDWGTDGKYYPAN